MTLHFMAPPPYSAFAFLNDVQISPIRPLRKDARWKIAIGLLWSGSYPRSPRIWSDARNFMRNVNTFIGSPVERVEDLRFLRGRGQYVDDLVRPGQWHAAIVRSPVAHGRLRSVDTAAALAMPGVHAVITAQDVGRPIPAIPFRRPNPTIAPYAQPVLADDVVRYVGEPVAVVLADSAERAEDARAGGRARHRASAGGRRPPCSPRAAMCC